MFSSGLRYKQVRIKKKKLKRKSNLTVLFRIFLHGKKLFNYYNNVYYNNVSLSKSARKQVEIECIAK